MKKTLLLRIINVFVYIALVFNAYSQTGPGGVGNGSGSDGQPANVIWIDAQHLSLSDGDAVSTWPDRSGNNHDMTSDGADPEYITGIAGINNKNVVRFDNSNNEILDFYPDFSDDISHTNYTFFWVAARRSDDSRQYVFGGSNDSENENLYSGWGYPGAETTPALCANQWSNNCAADWGSYDTDAFNEFGIISCYLDNSSGRELFENSTSIAFTSTTNQLSSQIGTQLAYREGGHYSDVDIAELIFFQTNLNEAQRIIVENYLSTKYNLPLDANDYYANSTYINDIIGIGTTDGLVKHSETSGSGGALLLEEANGTLDIANEFVFAGHNNTTHGLVKLDVTQPERARWARVWNIEKTTSNAIDIKIKFSTLEAGFGNPTALENYVLLYRSGTSGDFSEVTINSKTINTDNQVVFTVSDANFSNGYYTLGVPEYREWYTLISGDWDNWETWTLDPSGALPNNPNQYTPSTSPTANIDKVHILSGKTVTVGSDNKSNALIEVNGRLDFGTTSGHSFAAIRGNGRIILYGDNFPTGDASHFTTEGEGEGTVVYKGSGYSLTKSNTFYNVELIMNSNTDEVVLLNDYTINGDLLVENGVLKINNSSTDIRHLLVKKNVRIESNGKITVGSGDTYSTHSQYHQFTVQGDFINKGTVKLTNRTAAGYESDDTGGAVELIFNHPTQNQSLQCLNTSVFNQITIDKGIDKTYILDINASTSDYFKLYGRNDEEVSGDPGSRDGNKALRLLAGTVKLGSNIIIPVLAYDYSYDIDDDARLWLNGASVTFPTGNSNNWLAIYGTLQISSTSEFIEQTNFGTLIRKQGTFLMENGTVELNNFRTSTWDEAGDHVGAYIQRGGTVTVNNESANDDYATFHLPYETNTFQMSGGTLIVQDQQHSGDANEFAIIINSGLGNYNVTGGTVLLDMILDVNYRITSTAPFYNFTIRNSVDTDQTLYIDAFDENSGGDVPDVAAQPLVVLGDLTIEENCTLNTTGADVKIGGNFEFKESAQYIHGDNTTWFIGDDRAQINVRDNSTLHDLTFNNVTIYKDQRYNTELFYRVEVSAGSRAADNPPILIEGDLYIGRGEFDVDEWEIDLHGDLEIVDGKIIASDDPPGHIVFNGTLEQKIKGAAGKEQDFGKLELDKTDATASNTYLTFLSDINVSDFILTNGIANLDLYNLDVAGEISGTGYGDTKMYQTAGNASDGGLSLFIDLSEGTSGTETLFPIGTSGAYNPAILIQNGTIEDSGTLTINPVDDYHPSSTNHSKAIPYYWVVDKTGLDVVDYLQLKYTFTYNSGSIPGSINKGLNLWTEDYEWYSHNSVKNGSNLEFPYEVYLTGDYTIGNKSEFNQPIIYYSRVVSEDYNIGSMPQWSDNDTWSVESHTGDPGNNNAYPQDGDIAIIGYGGTGGGAGGNRHHVAYRASDDYKLAKVIIDASEESGVWDTRLFIEEGATIDMGVVDGDGTLEVHLDPSTPTTINGDFGDFTNKYDEGSRVLFHGEAGSEIELPSIFTRLPNVRLEGGGNRTIYFPDDVIILGELRVDYDATLRIEHDLQVNGKLRLGNYHEGILEFPDDIARTVTVFGDLELRSDNNSQVIVDNSSENNLEHRLQIYGNIELDRGNKFDLFSNTTGGNNVILELLGEEDKVFTNTDDMPVELYRLELNKLIGKSFTFYRDEANPETELSNFSINGLTNGDEKAIELISGNLNFNNSGIDVTLSSGGADFKIPESSTFQVKRGTARISGDNTGIWLDGKLNAAYGSTWYLNEGVNNYIEYSASGNAEISIYQAEFYVGSHIRRATDTEEGILNFHQEHENSTVIIGTDNSIPVNNRGVFEILNSGSNFEMADNATLIIANAQDNPEFPSLYLSPETSTLGTGSTIQLGDANTDANQEIGIYSTVNLKNLTTDNTSGNSPVARMWTIPLTLDEILTIGASTEFNANGLDLTVKGDFINNGTFTPNQNTTYFAGTSAQQLTGETGFYKLTKSTANTVTFNSAVTVSNLLTISDGTLADGGNTISVQGDVVNHGTHDWGDSGAGILFNGTEQQQLQTSGILGKITINNTAGVYVPTEAFAIEIDDAVALQNGIFDIGKNLLHLDQSAEFIELSAYSEANMIQTNMSFTDNGIKKDFPAIGSSTEYIYPIGSQGKYTPVTFDIAAMDAGGSLQVKAADERQSTVIDDSEACDEIDDLQNVLQYHWGITAENVSGFDAEVSMKYYDSDVSVTSPHSIDDYITARLLFATDEWNKYDNASFDQTNNLLKFSLEGETENISGEYTAGVASTCNSGQDNGAIPEVVATYISVANGNWEDPATWDTYPVSGGSVPLNGPRGAIVFIEHDVSVTSNYALNYKTNINAPGELNVASTFGHRLGYVLGNGTLYLERGDMPAGVYNDFIDSNGGTLEFGGTTDYDILSEMPQINNLTLSGTGERRFPNLDLSLSGHLTINGAALINEHDRTTRINKNVIFNSGSFDSGIGENAKIVMNGTAGQYIAGDFTGSNSFNNLEFDNASGIYINSPIEVDNRLILTSGTASTSTVNTLTVTNTDTDAVTGGDANTYINGPLNKKILDGQSFTFPVGKSGRFGEASIAGATASGGTAIWQAEYYNQNPYNFGYDPSTFQTPLETVSNTEFWRIKHSASEQAEVTIRWDDESDINPAYTDVGNIRMAQWLSDQWQEIGDGASGDSNYGTVSSTSSVALDEQVFTLAATANLVNELQWEGDVSSDWQNPDNWNPQWIPHSHSDVIINPSTTYQPVINAQVYCNKLTIEENATVTINPGQSIQLGGDFTLNGDLVLQSDASGAAGSLIDNGVITTGTNGQIIISRHFSGGKYHYVSSPINNANSDIYTTYYGGGYFNRNFLTYDETNTSDDWMNGWSAPLDNGTTIAMNPAQGYAVYYANDRVITYTGTPNTGEYSFAITHTDGAEITENEGWNFIGNPYPSAVDAYQFLTTNTNIDGYLRFWDDGGDYTTYKTDDYAYWNLSGEAGAGAGGNAPNGYIGSCQGFFVRKTNPGSGNLVFRNDMRAVENSRFFKDKTSETTERFKLQLISENNYFNEILIAFSKYASNGYDRLFDARKTKGNPNIALYTELNNEPFAIQTFTPKENDFQVPVCLDAGTSGIYTFHTGIIENFSPLTSIWLEDKKEGKMIDLEQNTQYAFSVEQGVHKERFVLHFNRAPLYTNWTGAVSTDWHEYGNWDNGVPTAYTNAVIHAAANAPAIQDEAQCLDLQLEAGCALSIAEQAQLTVHGNFTLKAVPNASASLLDNENMTVNGYTIMQKTWNADEQYLAIPLEKTGVEPFEETGISKFDETTGIWSNLFISEEILAMRGYKTELPEETDFAFYGELSTGDKSFALSNANQGFNLVGNPYPSYIDWNDTNGWQSENIEPTVYAWNGQNFSYYNRTTGVGVNSGSRYIAPFTAFFVKALQAGEFSVNNQARLSHPKPQSRESENLLRLRISSKSTENGTFFDETVVMLHENATFDYDAAYDAVKRTVKQTETPQIYSRFPYQNQWYAINTITTIDDHYTIPLGLFSGEEGQISIKAVENTFSDDIYIFLEDTYTSTLTEIKAQSTYSFYHQGNSADDRFILHLSPYDYTKIAEKQTNDKGIQIYSSKKNVFVNLTGYDKADAAGNIEIYNMIGAKIYEKQYNKQLIHKIELSTSGMYIVKVKNQEAEYAKKVFVE